MTRRMALVLLLALVAAACSSTDDADLPATTLTSESTELDEPEPTVERLTPDFPATTPIYESLELDSAENAVESLINAYDDRDFVRAWFIFDGHAQRRFSRAMNNLDFDEFRRGRALLPDSVIEGSSEHGLFNSIAMFARFFEDAARIDQLHVDLAGAQIESTEDGDAGADQALTATVTVRLADDASARLWMTTTPTQRWRVRQIAIDGVEFIDDGTVFVDGTCGDSRIRVHDGAECPSAEFVDWREDPDLVAQVDRLRAEAGDDPAAQIDAAQEINRLVNSTDGFSNEWICAAVQGNAPFGDEDVTDEFRARAEALIEGTCPGSIDLITNPPDLPPSGAEIGERTAYGRLRLSTPEDAVMTFNELFTNEAFMLLFFSLDAQAQNLLARSINNLDASTLVDPKVLETWDGVDDEAHFNTLVGNFASLMTEASATAGHLLDLSGPLEIIDTTPATWTEPRSEPVDAQIVEARSESLDDTVYFLMLESPSRRWRVRQVALDPAAFDSPADKRLVFIAP